MGRKKKVQEDPEEIIEGDYLDKPEELPEEDEEEVVEETEADPIEELRDFTIKLSEHSTKLQKAIVTNQKYITQQSKDIARLQADFKVLLEEK